MKLWTWKTFLHKKKKKKISFKVILNEKQLCIVWLSEQRGLFYQRETLLVGYTLTCYSHCPMLPFVHWMFQFACSCCQGGPSVSWGRCYIWPILAPNINQIIYILDYYGCITFLGWIHTDLALKQCKGRCCWWCVAWFTGEAMMYNPECPVRGTDLGLEILLYL